MQDIETLPTISDNPLVQAAYEQIRFDGTSHNLAEMFALQQAPSIDTDATFMAGHSDFTVNENSLVGSTMLAEARAAGVNPRGKVYKPSLARYPNDPLAWIESKADAIRRAEALGLKLEGSVNYTPPEIETTDLAKKPYRVAQSIVDDAYADAVESDPGLAKKKGFKEKLAAKLSGERV